MEPLKIWIENVPDYQPVEITIGKTKARIVVVEPTEHIELSDITQIPEPRDIALRYLHQLVSYKWYINGDIVIKNGIITVSDLYRDFEFWLRRECLTHIEHTKYKFGSQLKHYMVQKNARLGINKMPVVCWDLKTLKGYDGVFNQN